MEVTGITPASNQYDGVGNWALRVKFNMDKMQLCKSRRVTMTIPATLVRPFEQLITPQTLPSPLRYIYHDIP